MSRSSDRGAPGALLVDGEVVGAWRTKANAKRLDLTVRPLAGVTSGRRVQQAVEEEAAHLAQLRGVPDVTVSFAAE